MTRNQEARVREWLASATAACISTDFLPTVLIGYPAEDGEPGLTILALGNLTDEQIAGALHEALIAHCLGKGVTP